MNRFSKRFGSLSTYRPQPVSEVLNRTDAFAALRAGVEQVASLQRDLTALLPDYLASHVEPGSIKDGTLTLLPRTMRWPRGCVRSSAGCSPICKSAAGRSMRCGCACGRRMRRNRRT